MTDTAASQARCPKCNNAMIYVTSIPFRSMHRTTFVCYSCRQTKTYVLPLSMAEAYAAGGGSNASADKFSNASALPTTTASEPL
jgi:hypothetical protein